MFIFHCPHCHSERDESEFSYAGEAFISRPSMPDPVSDETWGDYLFMRKNTKGWHWEQWMHSAGCRKMIVVKRHTNSHNIAGSWTMSEARQNYLREQV